MRQKTPKEPCGKERMRRSPPRNFNLRPKRFEFDVKKAYDQNQLAEIGAVTLVWNQVEAAVGHILFMMGLTSWRVDPKVLLKLLDAMKGLEDKIEILRTLHQINNLFDDKTRNTIEISFAAIIENRTNRNGIVHSMIFDHEKGIAEYKNSKKEKQQILVTKDALVGLYQRLDSLKNELHEIQNLYRLAYDRGIIVNDKDGQPETDQNKALRERVIPEYTQKLKDLQKIRQSLSPLPEFPDAHLILPKVKDAEIHPKSKKTD
jgi:hypothetical protein